MNDELISAEETAEILGITKASIKNWEKHSLLVRMDGKFAASEVNELLKSIKNGTVSRLSSRANKKQASGTTNPSGHILQKTDAAALKAFLKKCPPDDTDLNTVIFTAVLKQLQKAGLINMAADGNLRGYIETEFRHPAVKAFISSWYAETALTTIPFSSYLHMIPELQIEDPAGCIYQAMLQRGEMAVKGSFYTPGITAEEMTSSAVAGLKADKGNTAEKLLFLDPCCGSGQFLLSFAEAGASPENIIGFDSDPIAVRIAKANLMARFPEIDFSPKIICTDALEMTAQKMHELIGSKPDIIVTNPPWGAELKQSKGEDSFSSFLKLSCRLVSEGGMVSMLLPESVTNIKKHKTARKEILENAEITSIINHGRIFKNVFTSVVSLEFRKKTIPERNAQSSRYLGNADYIFDFYLKSEDSAIIQKIEKKAAETLTGNAEWALGIVTGDNRRYLRSRESDNAEPVITGSDIYPGFIKPASKFIIFEKDRLQQAAAEELYRKPEKIVYRFISKKLICAVDTCSSLTLNSANIIIPDESFISCRLLTEIFNTDLYNFIYQKRFNALKVLRKNLEALPLPEPEAIEQGRKLLNPGQSNTEDILYDYYGISVKETEYIRSELR